MDKFWLWLLRFSYRRLLIINPKMPYGVPGLRDSQNKCSGYEPRKRKLQDWSDCESDGHYLCNECCHLTEGKEEPDDWREEVLKNHEREKELLEKLKGE